MNNGKICVSVCAETADEMIVCLRRAEEFADVIEVRFDCLRPDQIGVLRSAISNLRSEKYLLATYRSPEQGGHGTATHAERAEFWQNLPDVFWGLDLEADVTESAPPRQHFISSFHDFSGVPDDLDRIYTSLGVTGDIVKIAVTASDITDAIPVWRLIERAKADVKQMIPVAMGEAGKWTRILGLAHGAFLTYASLEAGIETADGQITAKELNETYRVKELDQNTKVVGIVGDPVSQSLSPYFQNPAFAVRNVNAVFIPLLVKNLDEFMIQMVKSATREVELNFGGFSVTMPHKQAIIKHLDAIDPTAEKIGAVNTIKIADGKLTGYNTDAHGFITPLKERFGGLRDARVAVFGAGGASRACVYALKQEGADVTIFARDMSKAETFASEFGIRCEQLTTHHRPLTTDIIVDATPLGMKGLLETESLFTADGLSGVKFVYDLVTKSTDTPILREAKMAGIPTLNGVEMLLAQGAKQFEIWTGLEAPVDLMRESLISRMNAKYGS